MKYVELIELGQHGLTKNPNWVISLELQNNLDLPIKQPYQTWIRQLEGDIGLIRSSKVEKRANIWKLCLPEDDNKSVPV